MQKPLRKGTGREFAGMMDVFRKHAGTSVYTGFAVSIPAVVVYRAEYFGLYDTAIGLFKPKSTTIKFFIAQGVVMSASLASYPFQLIQHRLIMQAGTTEPIYRGALDCFRKIVKTDGMSWLFKGAGASMIKHSGGVFLLIAYDTIRRS